MSFVRLHHWEFKMNRWRTGIAKVVMVFTLPPIFALAADCNEVRLDLAGSAFDKIPVYNQTDKRGVDADICYAIASSQLVDEYRFRKGDMLAQISSPLSLAIGYKMYSQDSVNRNFNTEEISSSNITRSILGGGFIEETVLSAKQMKICDHYAIENEAGLVNSTSIKSAQQFVEEILLGERSPKVKSFFKLDFLNAVKSELENKCKNDLFTLNKIDVKGLSPGNYLDDLAILMHAQENKSFSDDEKQKILHGFTQKYDKSKIVQNYMEKINVLLKQKIPIGIGYFMKVLKKSGPTDEFSAHASIITGERANPTTGICELLVRDSYGPNCKDDQGKDRYGRPCENGSVWVPADELLSETAKISWIP
jgi:hypothetical protein